MQIKQYNIKDVQQITMQGPADANMVLVFGERSIIEGKDIYQKFHAAFPDAQIIFCSTAGEILDTSVSDNTLAVTAVKWEKTEVKASVVNMADFKNSAEAGKLLVEGLRKENKLRHIFVLADGQQVNGSELVEGMNSTLHDSITISGGLAGDGARFQKTLVGLNDNIREGNIVAIGLCGDNLVVGYGSNGGWDSFGPYRKITKSKANVLYEMEGKSALELYKQYLGELAAGLPGNALLFPLSIKVDDNSEPVVRTILSINDNDNSMTFAGNMPEGAQARLMKASFDRLIDAAADAASNTNSSFKDVKPQLALLVSCVGRKLVLNQRVEEEVERVRDILGPGASLTGFYSYGEISPLSNSAKSDLHNQTMTITALSET